MYFVSIVVIVLLAAVLFYVVRVRSLFANALVSIASTRGGSYSAFSLDELQAAAAKRASTHDKMERSGGYIPFNEAWLQARIDGALTIDQVIREAEGNAEATLEWQRAVQNHDFMLQANLDVVNGKKTVSDIEQAKNSDKLAERLKEVRELEQQKKKLESWIREDYPRLLAESRPAAAN